MYHSKISVRYAKALFELAKERDVLYKVRRNMSTLYHTFPEVPDLLYFLENPIIKTSKKIEVMREAFKTNFIETSFSIIDLVLKNKRELYLREIARNYIYMYRKHSGIIKVILTTAVEVNNELTDRLSKLIQTAYNHEVDLKQFIDKDIVGGFVIRIDDQQIDASIATKLNEIKKELKNTIINSQA